MSTPTSELPDGVVRFRLPSGTIVVAKRAVSELGGRVGWYGGITERMFWDSVNSYRRDAERRGDPHAADPYVDGFKCGSRYYFADDIALLGAQLEEGR